MQVIFNISKYGLQIRQRIVESKGIMSYLMKSLGASRTEDEMEEDDVQLVINTLLHLVNDPATKDRFLLYLATFTT